MKAFLRSSLVALCLLALPMTALAGLNISVDTAPDLHVGQQVSEYFAAGTDGYFKYYLIAGRSYCVEASNGARYPANFDRNDPTITVYDSDGTTQLFYNDDTALEPRAGLGARACFVNPGTAGVINERSVRLHSLGGAAYFDLRLVETTLFSAFFYTYGDWTTSVQMRNTMSSTVSYTVNFRNVAGTILGSYSSSLGANSSVNINAFSVSGIGANKTGSIDIVHNGSPEAISANATTLSYSLGQAFAGPFFTRQPW